MNVIQSKYRCTIKSNKCFILFYCSPIHIHHCNFRRWEKMCGTMVFTSPGCKQCLETSFHSSCYCIWTFNFLNCLSSWNQFIVHFFKTSLLVTGSQKIYSFYDVNLTYKFVSFAGRLDKLFIDTHPDFPKICSAWLPACFPRATQKTSTCTFFNSLTARLVSHVRYFASFTSMSEGSPSVTNRINFLSVSIFLKEFPQYLSAAPIRVEYPCL